MSKFSGKCDVYDWFGMIACMPHETPFECYKRRKAVIKTFGGRKLDIKKPSDLVPFYPFLTAVLTSSDGSDTILLSDHSYMDDQATIISSSSYMHYMHELVDEYDRVVKEEDPKYV